MKQVVPEEIERGRVKIGMYASDKSMGMKGAFLIENPLATDRPSKTMLIIVSDEGGWDHVSVSLNHRCPRWEEMEYVKRTLFNRDEVAYQLHIPAAQHINTHPFCLHIWRKQDFEIPLPPTVFV